MEIKMTNKVKESIAHVVGTIWGSHTRMLVTNFLAFVGVLALYIELKTRFFWN